MAEWSNTKEIPNQRSDHYKTKHKTTLSYNIGMSILLYRGILLFRRMLILYSLTPSHMCWSCFMVAACPCPPCMSVLHFTLQLNSNCTRVLLHGAKEQVFLCLLQDGYGLVRHVKQGWSLWQASGMESGVIKFLLSKPVKSNRLQPLS